MAQPDHPSLEDRPVPELLRTLSDQTAALVREELELARVEMTAKGKRAGVGFGMFGAAGAVTFWMLGALTAAAILALSLAVAAWVAALIVCGVLAIVAGGLALVGRSEVAKGVPPTPQQTVQTVKEDVEVARDRVKAGRS